MRFGGLERLVSFSASLNADLVSLVIPSSVRVLAVGYGGVEKVELAGDDPQLRYFNANQSRLASLDGVAEAKRLARVQLIGCVRLTSIAPLAGKAELEYLDLERCLNISDISAVQSIGSLSWIDISGTGVEDVSPLASCESLRTVRAFGLPRESIRALQEFAPRVLA
jgi:internalin A